MSKNVEEDDEDKLPRGVLLKYQERLKMLKRAQVFSRGEKIPQAVQCYQQYLRALAAFHRVTEDQLKPALFNQEKEIAELLLVSQVYWDLAKAFDRNPKLHSHSEKYLEQFIKFSLGYKFQYINAEMLRKFIKKGHAYNPKAFERAYEQIRVTSKKCYVASYCFSESHYITSDLRDWKKSLLRSKFGCEFIDQYYRFSPLFVNFCLRHPLIGLPLKYLFMRPALYLFSRLIKAFIL
jgi:hypothetical protein